MKTIEMTKPKVKTVCGYEIKKAHIGAYLDALSAIENMPGELLAACFEGEAGGVLGALSGMDENGLLRIVTKALTVAPVYAMRLVSRLLEIDESELLRDRNIGLKGIVEMLTAWAEVNDLTGFMTAVESLKVKWTAARNLPNPTTGFKGLFAKLLSSVSAKKNS